jgi:hypothetical protein
MMSRSRSILLAAAAAFLVTIIFSPAVHACVRINGVTGDWRVVQPGEVLNLGSVGKGSVLYFYVDVRERNGCPAWDNWDRMWAKSLPPGVHQQNTNWFEIYFHPYTLIVTSEAKDGSYLVPLCVQDQGTGKIECFNVRFLIEEPKLKLNYTISRDFNTIILTIRNLGNVWQVCNVSTNLPAELSRKSFYLPANGYSGNLYIYPEKEGKLVINLSCTASNLSITYDYRRMLVDVNSKKLAVYPGQHTYVLLRKLPGVSLSVVASPGISAVLDYPKLEIFVPSDAKPGNYTINITAELGNRKQQLSILVQVKSKWPLICPFINVYVFNSTVTVQGLKPAVIPVMFWNQDSQDHDVPVSVETSCENLIVKFPESVHLPAGKKVFYNLTVASLDYGNYTLKLKLLPCNVEKIIHVTFQKPSSQEKIIYPLAEIKDPILELIPSEISVYPSSGNIINVSFKVINPNNNVVCSCNLNGKSFVVAKEYDDILIINVSKFFLAGTYTYPVNLYCTCGNKSVVKNAKLTIHVREYHQIVVEPESVILKVPKGSFEIKVINQGNVPERISLGSTCQGELSFSQTSLTLEPRSQQTVKVQYNFNASQASKPCAILISGDFGQRIVSVSLQMNASQESSKVGSKRGAAVIGVPLFAPFYYLLRIF